MDFKSNIDQLKIDKNIITIIASGDSVDKITPEQFEYLKKNTYVITMNYGPIKFLPHANIFSDFKVTELLRDMYSRKPKDHVFISRREAFKIPDWTDFYPQIDHWFSTEKNEVKGNYTLLWLFQLLHKHFPNKFVAIFGLDLKPIDPANDIHKWYDRYTKQDANRRGKNFPLQRKLDQFQQQLNDIINQDETFKKWTENVMNCNPDSHCNTFRKISWDSLVGNNWNK